MAYDPVPANGMPTHVACIMDGNGRWAKRRGMERIEGHSAGEKAILAAVNGAISTGIQWLTLFAFSTENWNRPTAEVDFLMQFNQRIIERHGFYFHNRGVRVRYIGSPDERIPARLKRRMELLEELTASNQGMTLTIAFNYGGRRELVEAVGRILASGRVSDQLCEQLITENTQFPDMPDIDLLIRTAGEYRISNFMLWRLAYAELVFFDMYWPDFTEADLLTAIQIFQQRIRRFGSHQ